MHGRTPACACVCVCALVRVRGCARRGSREPPSRGGGGGGFLRGSMGKVAPASKRPRRTLSFWCFKPGVAMMELLALGVRSVVLTR
jgi:hypothetical protein